MLGSSSTARVSLSAAISASRRFLRSSNLRRLPAVQLIFYNRSLRLLKLAFLCKIQKAWKNKSQKRTSSGCRRTTGAGPRYTGPPPPAPAGSPRAPPSRFQDARSSGASPSPSPASSASCPSGTSGRVYSGPGQCSKHDAFRQWNQEVSTAQGAWPGVEEISVEGFVTASEAS